MFSILYIVYLSSNLSNQFVFFCIHIVLFIYFLLTIYLINSYCTRCSFIIILLNISCNFHWNFPRVKSFHEVTLSTYLSILDHTTSYSARSRKTGRNTDLRVYAKSVKDRIPNLYIIKTGKVCYAETVGT